MKHAFKSLGLVFLLMAAQQGAVVHDLSHVSRANDAALKVESGGVAHSSCALCPAFAQAATPAFSHSIHLPSLIRAGTLSVAEPQVSPVFVAVPTPRSRGPPSLS